ncbi:MAG: hypothetical protein AB7F86_02245 [Bdellovibrionales bacterium]
MISLMALLIQLAFAFPSSGHRFVLTESSQIRLDTADSWNSEVSSDFIQYQRPLVMEGVYLQQPQIYDLSVGSLSGQQFLFYQRLKMEKNLLDALKFKIDWRWERDYEMDRQTLPIELEARLTPEFSIGAFSELSYHKAEDDVGVAFYWRPTAQWEQQASVEFGDFQRNERNVQPDRWSRAPVAYVLSSLHRPGQESTPDFDRLEVFYQPKTVRSQSGSPQTTLALQSVSVATLRSVARFLSLGGRVYAEEAYSEDHSNSLIRRRQRILAQAQSGFTTGRYRLEPGVNYFYRESRTNHETDIRRELLPSLNFYLPDQTRSWGFLKWQITYDVNFYDQDSTRYYDQRKIEHRLGVKSGFQFRHGGELTLLMGFDVDQFGTSRTWEGGAGQFQVSF